MESSSFNVRHCSTKNMQDVRDHGYRPWNDVGAEIVNAFHYLEKIANLAEVDISNWEVCYLLQVGHNYTDFAITDENKINGIFFKEVEKRKALGPHEVNCIPVSRLEEIKEQAASIESARIDSLSMITNTGRKLAAKLFSNYELIISQSEAANRELSKIRFNGFKADGTRHVRMLNQILGVRNRFFTLAGSPGDVGRDCFVFKTKNVVLSHTNRNAAIDITVPLGKFHVYYYHQSKAVYVYPEPNGKNVVVNDGYFHPHVSTDGIPCIGDNKGDFVGALQKGDLKTVFLILSHVLTSYNDGNPYAGLYEFRDKLLNISTDEPLTDEDGNEVSNNISDVEAQLQHTGGVRVEYDSISEEGIQNMLQRGIENTRENSEITPDLERLADINSSISETVPYREHVVPQPERRRRLDRENAEYYAQRDRESRDRLGLGPNPNDVSGASLMAAMERNHDVQLTQDPAFTPLRWETASDSSFTFTASDLSFVPASSAVTYTYSLDSNQPTIMRPEGLDSGAVPS